jgi:hypothetical protein
VRGTTIADDCRALPVRDLATGEFTGKAQFFVNCGDDQRARGRRPNNGDPYFIQMVAQTGLGRRQDRRALTTMSVNPATLAATASLGRPKRGTAGRHHGPVETAPAAETTTTALTDGEGRQVSQQVTALIPRHHRHEAQDRPAAAAT